MTSFWCNRGWYVMSFWCNLLASHETAVVVCLAVIPTHRVVNVGTVAGGRGLALPLIGKLSFTRCISTYHIIIINYTCILLYHNIYYFFQNQLLFADKWQKTITKYIQPWQNVNFCLMFEVAKYATE